MGRHARFVPLAGAVLLLGRLLACTSTGNTARMGGGGSSAATGGGGSAATGVTQNCFYNMGCQVGAAYCKNNTFMVPIVPCDQSTLTCAPGPMTVQSTVCPAGNVCNAGAGGCLAPLAPPPAEACTLATDCALPPSACVDVSYLATYSDPICDAGQCRWKLNVDHCFEAACYEGTCGQPPYGMTAGPSPGAYPAIPPPPSAPAQTCASAPDCKLPAPACFAESVVTFVDPACENGACVWESSFAPCPAACSNGACAAAQCTMDADCSPWPATCTNNGSEPVYWSVESCPAPTCSAGTCQCPDPKVTACGFGNHACVGGMCVAGDGGVEGGGTGGSGP